MSSFRSLCRSLKRRVGALSDTLLPVRPLQPFEFSAQPFISIVFICDSPNLRDLVMATPAFRAVREAFPHSHLTVIAPGVFKAIIEDDQAVNGFVDLKPRGLPQILSAARGLFRLLLRRPDLAIVLDSDRQRFVSELLLLLTWPRFRLTSEARALQRSFTGPIYNLISPYHTGRRHPSERRLDVIRHLGVDTGRAIVAPGLSANESGRALNILRHNGVDSEDFILYIYAGPETGTDGWPFENLLRVVRHFSVFHSAHIAVQWPRPNSRHKRLFMRERGAHYLDLSGLNIRDHAALMSVASLAFSWSMDGICLSSALRTPLIGILKKRDLDEWRPGGEEMILLTTANENMATVGAGDVIGAAEALLAESERREKSRLDISERVLDEFLGFGDIRDFHTFE